MKGIYIILPLLYICTAVAAQDSTSIHRHAPDSTDVFYQHLDLSEITVVGVTGNTKLKHSTAPLSIVTSQTLQAAPTTNIIDAIARQPGISQLTTGNSISKPIIRGLGYNRVVVISEGIRQEGQQWGDEHGIETDPGSVGSVEIVKGPASLLYGSDAMAGAVILRPRPLPAEGEIHAGLTTQYQTNNGHFHNTMYTAGNHRGFVWDGNFTHDAAHAYKNKYDGYVPGSQYSQIAGRLKLGLNRAWGHTHITFSTWHQTPGIVEGGRDPDTGQLLRPNGWSSHHYGHTLPYQHIVHHKLVSDNLVNLPYGYITAVVGYQQNRRQEYEENADQYEMFLKLHTLTYDIRYVSNTSHGWKFSAGTSGMYQNSGNYGEECLLPDYRILDFGIYATATKHIGSRWTLNGGVRYDHRRLHAMPLTQDGNQRFSDILRHFNGVTGSLGAVCNVTRQLNIRLNLARGYRSPNISELASNGIHHGTVRYEIGNAALRPEYSLQADIGLDYTNSFLTALLALFANHIDNYIYAQRDSRTIDPRYRTYIYTQGSARLLGFEAGIDLHPIHSLHFSNAFSYVNARLNNATPDARWLPNTPAPRWTSELKWEILHHSHSTIAHRHDREAGHAVSRHRSSLLNNLYLAARLDYNLSQTHVYSADGTETPTPAYALLSIAAGTDIQVKGKTVARLHIIADNLLDKAYQSHLSRLKYTDTNLVTNRTGVYDMGRNITIKLTIPLVWRTMA